MHTRSPWLWTHQWVLKCQKALPLLSVNLTQVTSRHPWDSAPPDWSMCQGTYLGPHLPVASKSLDPGRTTKSTKWSKGWATKMSFSIQQWASTWRKEQFQQLAGLLKKRVWCVTRILNCWCWRDLASPWLLKPQLSAVTAAMATQQLTWTECNVWVSWGSNFCG